MDEKLIAAAKLHDFFKLFMRPSSLTGMTIFTLDSETRLQFSFLNCAFLLLIIRSVLALLLTRYQGTARVVLEIIFGFQSETLNSVTNVLAYTILVENALGNVFIFLQRQRIIKFQDNLIKGLVELVNDCKSLRVFESLIEQTHRRIVIMLKIIFGLCLYGLVIVPPIFSLALLEEAQNLNKPDAMLAFMMTCIWSTMATLHYLRRVWYIAVLHCLKIYVVLISESSNMLEKSEKFENLLEDFNEVFGSFFSLDILSLTLTQIMLSFLFGMFIIMDELGPLTTSIFSLIINSSAIFVFCDAIEELNQEIRRLAASLKKSSVSRCPRRIGVAISTTMLHSSWITKSVGVVPGSPLSLGRAACGSVSGT